MKEEKFPYKSLFILIAAAIYTLSPLDIVPDAFLGFGQLDDIGILFIAWHEFKNILSYRRAVKNKQPPDIVAEVKAKPSESEEEK